MKRVCAFVSMVLLLACSTSQQGLKKNATELFNHIPDVGNLEKCREYLTNDFYASLEEMVSLPDFTPVLHEWELWFTAADGSTMADNAYEVKEVELTDKTHAKAVILVQPANTDYDAEEHIIQMEKVDGKWLLSDYDDTKQSSLRYIDNYRKEESVRNAISDYLVKEIGAQYRQGEVCIPVSMIVAAEEDDATHARIWGDFWVYWYNVSDDTLKTVSGGNHSGCMSLSKQGETLAVTAFEQTEDGAGNDPSARRIFGRHYDVYQTMHSNQDVLESARKEAIRNYCSRNGLDVKYYQDFGWPAKALQAD